MAELVAAHVDLDAVTALARPLPPGPAWSPDVVHDAADRGRARPTAGAALEAGAGAPAGRAAGAPPVRVAVFGGQAFTFGYAEHVELLAAAGAEVVVVDPLRDARLPDGTAALVLPGGFPEEHVGALAANVELRAAVRALADSGAPVHAECGGLLYLCATLDGAPDVRRPARRRDDDGPAHAGLPRCRGAHPVPAAPRGRPGDRARVPPLRRHPPRRRTRRGRGAAPSPRASSTAACTPRSCTPTPRGSRRPSRGSSRPPLVDRPSPALPSAGRSARRSGVAGGRHGGPAVAPGRVVPLHGGVDHADARRRPHDLRRHPRLRPGPLRRADRRAVGGRSAVPAEDPRGAGAPRAAGVGRRPRLRARLPRPPLRPARSRLGRAAARARRPPHVAPARPGPAALGDLPGRGALRRPVRDRHQDPPRDGRRAVVDRRRHGAAGRHADPARVPGRRLAPRARAVRPRARRRRRAGADAAGPS